MDCVSRLLSRCPVLLIERSIERSPIMVARGVASNVASFSRARVLRSPLPLLPPDEAGLELAGVRVSGVASALRLENFSASACFPSSARSCCSAGLRREMAACWGSEDFWRPWYVACFLLACKFCLSLLIAHIGRLPKKTPLPPAGFIWESAMNVDDLLPSERLVFTFLSPLLSLSSSIQADKEGADEAPRVILKPPGLLLMPRPPMLLLPRGADGRVAGCVGVIILLDTTKGLSCSPPMGLFQTPACPQPSFIQFGIAAAFRRVQLRPMSMQLGL